MEAHHRAATGGRVRPKRAVIAVLCCAGAAATAAVFAAPAARPVVLALAVMAGVLAGVSTTFAAAALPPTGLVLAAAWTLALLTGDDVTAAMAVAGGVAMVAALMVSQWAFQDGPVISRQLVGAAQRSIARRQFGALMTGVGVSAGGGAAVAAAVTLAHSASQLSSVGGTLVAAPAVLVVLGMGRSAVRHLTRR